MTASGLTPSQTVGPYLALGLPWELGPVADPGGVRIAGTVIDGAGQPVPDAAVEVWAPHPPAFARALSDDDGRWEVTVPEVPVLAAHVFARGLLRHLTTRIYLAAPDGEDPVLAAVPAARRATLFAERSDDGYRFDIRIQGAGETVFFDV